MIYDMWVIYTIGNLKAGPAGYSSAYGNKNPWTMDSQQTSRMNHGWTVISYSSEEGHFISWTQAGHQKQFMEINYVRIGLFMANLTVVWWHVYNSVIKACNHHLTVTLPLDNAQYKDRDFFCVQSSKHGLFDKRLSIWDGGWVNVKEVLR
jgi:hypothetical protein